MNAISLSTLDVVEPVRAGFALPEPSGDWSADNRAGRDFATDLIERMATEEAPFLLGNLAKGMVAGGRYGGVEVGFFHRIAETLTT
jgi:hypothetical protein